MDTHLKSRRLFLRSKKIIYGLVVAFLLFAPTLSLAAVKDDPVRETALDFVALMDGGSFIQAWGEGSDLFQMTTQLDSWVETQRIQREMLGALVERKVKTAIDRQSLPGFPDGAYRMYIFNSQFENKKSAYEIISFKKTVDGNWRVVTYLLR